MIYIMVLSLAMAIVIAIGKIKKIKHAERISAVIGYIIVAIFAGIIYWLNNF